MKKHKLRSIFLLVLLTVFLMSCRTEGSYLQYDKKSILKDVEYLNTHYMEIDIDGDSVLYSPELFDSYGTWYLKRDEKKEYSCFNDGDDWIVRLNNKGYWVEPFEASESGQTEVWTRARGDEGLKEQDASLDRIFEFYAMMNVRDNTKRTYTKKDKEFKKLVKYYSKMLDPDPTKDLARIDYFKIREGKTKGSTYLAVGGKYKEYINYGDSASFDEENGEYVYWEDAVEIRFDVDAKKFTKRYDELVHTVETTPLSKPQKR